MRHVLLGFIAVFAAAVPAAFAGNPAPNTVEQIVMRHQSAFDSGDVEGVLADYADEAVVITPGGKTQGKQALRKMFAGLFGGPPASRAPLHLTLKVFTDELGYIVWVRNAGKPEEVRGSDTFLLRNGQIVAQTVMVVPLHAPLK